MTPDDFKAWRKTMGYTQAQAANALGVSKPTIENYERGTRREDDRPVAIPHATALACTALYLELGAWPITNEDVTVIRRKTADG